jgi:hypothetical protein
MLLGKPDVGEDADNAARAAPSTGYMHVCYVILLMGRGAAQLTDGKTPQRPCGRCSPRRTERLRACSMPVPAEARLRKKAAPQLGDSRRTKTSGLPVPAQVQPCRWKERAESGRRAADGHADVGRGLELLGIRRVGCSCSDRIRGLNLTKESKLNRLWCVNEAVGLNDYSRC